MKKTQLSKIIQRFHDQSFDDPILREMVEEFSIAQRLTGITDQVLLSKIYDYLDNKLQEEIRSKMKGNSHATDNKND